MRSLSPTAVKILEARYLRRDSLARVVESPKDLFRRVAHAVAQAEAAFSSLDEVDYYENEYYRMMSHLEFLPNSPTLMNAGREHGQ
ncbi:MAG TPA: ribonucleotide reductase N-terminal alpha domain-containing protein, partial [bacterium]|nr:ribonucleotide reductase N-terminal alpha domain-containing protein [bacterium]